MSIAEYLRYRLGKESDHGALTLKAASFGELCLLAVSEFGEDTLRNWGVLHVVEPYVKAADS